MPACRPRADAGFWLAGAPRGANGWRLKLVGKNKLPRSVSLKRRAEIDSLFEKGQRFPTDFFTLIWHPGETFRFGVFVGRALGNATQRNRIKRRFREAIRLSRNNLKVTGQVALVPRAVDREPDLERLINDVSRIFQRLSSSS